MRRLFLCVPVAAMFLVSGELAAQRGGSRDGGGRDGRGGQGSRGSPTPSFSPPNRPNTSSPQQPPNRPSLIPETGPNRPGGGGNRPNRPDLGGGNRPSRPDLGGGNRPPTGGGNRPSLVPGSPPNRPVGGGNRPGAGGGNRPNRPDLGGGNRPPTGGNRPNVPERPGFGGGNRPPSGGGNSPGQPGIGEGNRPPVGGGNRPGVPDRPGAGGNRPDRPGGPGGNRPPVGGGNRPNRPDRPGAGGNRPNPPDRPGSGGNRPGFPDRPGGGGNRPSFPDRPGSGGNRPGFPDRPGIGGGNRPTWPGGGRPPGSGGGNFNRPNRPGNRPVRPPDRPIIINNRPINITTIRPGSRPWFDYHFHPWHRGYWGWWQPAGWFVGGTSVGWMLAPRAPTFVFSNPFVSQSTVVFNYSQPLPAPPDDPFNDPQALDVADWAVETFDRARAAFARGDPGAALALVDSAITELPTDATLHEFRALCLFALKDFRRAAETLYVVLAAGPGWDWQTMHALYADVATYTEQLRALEAYQRANPQSPEASFVLAYHYLVLGHLDAAIRKVENVVKLLPQSQLSSELLTALRAEANQHAPSPG